MPSNRKPARTAAGNPPDDDAIFSLDTLEAEAESKPFPFTLGGERFELPAATDMDFTVAEKLESGRYADALKSLLGEHDFNRILKKRLSVRQLDQLFTGYAKHQGITPGESSASARS